MAYQEWSIRNFSEGMIDGVDDNLLPDGATGDCQNFISRIVGSLTKRPGQTRLNQIPLSGPVQGMSPFYFNNSHRLAVVAGGKVSVWDGNSFSDIKTGLSSTATTMFETCVNYMVSFNGLDSPWKWDGTSVTPLENAPQLGQFPTLHKEKLFVVPSNEPSQLQWSDSFKPEVWPAVNYWDIKKGDGDEITGLSIFLSELVIFKRRSIHALRGNTLDDFRLDETESKIGCVGPLAMTINGLYLYFIADDGIYSYNGIRTINLTEDRIPKLWSRINKEHIHKSVVGTWKGLIWFALPENGSSYNNMVLIYDPPADGAAGGKFWVWRGINASCFQKFNTGTDTVFYAGDSMEGHINEQYSGTEDFGQPISAHWVGRAFDMGSPEREKKAKQAFVQDSPDTTGVVDLQVSLDYTLSQSLVYRTGGNLVREYRFPSGAKWRYLAPKFVHDKPGGCEVRGLLISYRARRKPKA